MKILPCLLLLASPLSAQIVGAWESFTQEDNATSWFIYDFQNDPFPALWFNDTEDTSIGDIYATFTDDVPVSLFAFADSSSGAFVGDYTAAGIDSLECDVLIEDASNFDVFEFYISSNGVEYYSEFIGVTAAGYSTQSYSFTKDQWYIFDEDEGFEIPVTLTPEILSNISQIGVNFYPLSDAADGQLVAIDNFSLLPDLTPPELSITDPTGEVIVSFQMTPAVSYDLEMSQTLQENDWSGLDDDTSDIRGEGLHQSAITARPKSFFRITTYPLYNEIP